MNTDEKPRWRYRFDNFGRAFALLREAIGEMDERELSSLEREGIVQRFEYTWELAWKTLKDYLEYQGIVLPSITPRAVLKAAVEAGIVDRGDDWMDALDARNRMAHTYDLRAFEMTVIAIRSRYLGLLDWLYDMLLDQTLDADTI